ncbi:hypothetical protein, partial [Rhodopseudomonas sp.]|uniref:hypothetical protein n=1 Tax=Rhodopseudomonas sp. TaxID=1078 RepID=UPI003B3B30AC
YLILFVQALNDDLSFVFRGRAALLREPGIHTHKFLVRARRGWFQRRAEVAVVMDSGLALRAPRNDEREG